MASHSRLRLADALASPQTSNEGLGQVDAARLPGLGRTHDQAMLAVDDGSVDGEEVPAEVQIPPLQSACLADSEAGPRKQIDTRVDDPSARCAVRRGDHFPLPSLVNKPVANLKFHRQDAAPVRRCWLALLLWFRSSHRLVSTDPQKM